MAFKLNVRCHGIIACVEAIEGDQVALLLCQAGRDVVNEQVAYVRFPASSYRDDNQREPVEAPLEFSVGKPARKLRYIPLLSERLSIVANVARHHRDLQLHKERDKRKSRTPTKIDGRSLVWLPDLDELSDGKGEMKLEYFTSPASVSPRLLARVDFTQGHLGTNGADTVQVPFRNKNPKMPRLERKVIARELVLELDVDGDSFTLRSEGLDGSYDPRRDMHFRPKGDLEIVIGNEAKADIFTRVSAIEAIDVVASKCMAEFAFYFKMCADPADDPLLPYLSARPGSESCCSVVKPKPSPFVKAPLAETIGLEAQETQPEWTVLTFIAADNDLSRAVLGDLDELESADPTKVNVVVQIDRPDEITERLVLEKTGFQKSLEMTQNLNSGDVDVLTDFLIAGKAARPATNTAVFFPTHGTGLLDFTFKRLTERGETDRLRSKEFIRDAASMHLRSSTDLYFAVGPDVTARDFIDNQELVQGLRAALGPDERFAILGFDACVMALVEMAYQVRLAGDYFVASQDDVRAEGWPYSKILERLSAAKTRPEAAVAIVEEFESASEPGDELATLSAIDLGELPELVQALDKLGGLLLPVVPRYIDALAQARDAARSFSNFHYIDLSGFIAALRTALAKFRAKDPDVAAVDDAAEAVLKHVGRVVLRTNDVSQRTSASGLSIYLPNSPVAPEYHKLLISRDAKHWHDFVVAYTTYR